jgi:hypothetical protein
LELPNAVQTHCRLSDSIVRCRKTERKTRKLTKYKKTSRNTTSNIKNFIEF